MPSPVLADTLSAVALSSPIVSSIWVRTRSWSAAARSILLSTGMIVWSLSTARYALAIVCASTPWVASTTRIDPSLAARLRLTSYVKSTWPGVSIRLMR